jgi:type IV secretory pathway TrbF-like protein
MESNPYLEARREWDERYADLVLGKRNWQIAAGGLLLLSLILASGIVWLGSRSCCIPYVVEVDKLGYALTVPQPLTPVALPDVTARMERYELAAFMRPRGRCIFLLSGPAGRGSSLHHPSHIYGLDPHLLMSLSM